jgi:hypothetical protein
VWLSENVIVSLVVVNRRKLRKLTVTVTVAMTAVRMSMTATVVEEEKAHDIHKQSNETFEEDIRSL